MVEEKQDRSHQMAAEQLCKAQIRAEPDAVHLQWKKAAEVKKSDPVGACLPLLVWSGLVCV